MYMTLCWAKDLQLLTYRMPQPLLAGLCPGHYASPVEPGDDT